MHYILFDAIRITFLNLSIFQTEDIANLLFHFIIFQMKITTLRNFDMLFIFAGNFSLNEY
jgi:hypothetical protein